MGARPEASGFAGAGSEEWRGHSSHAAMGAARKGGGVGMWLLRGSYPRKHALEVRASCPVATPHIPRAAKLRPLET